MKMNLKNRKLRILSFVLTIILSLNMTTISTFAENDNTNKKTNWSFEHWDNKKAEWVSGNAFGYDEGDYVPHAIDAKNYVPTGQPIEVELDYMIFDNGIPTIGYDEATNFFIGPLRNGTVETTSGSAIYVTDDTPIDDIPHWFDSSSTTFTVT